MSLTKEWEEEGSLAEKTGKPRPEPDPIPLDTRLETLTKAVLTPARPHAWALIDAHPEVFDDPAALRKEITDGGRL